MNPIKLAAVIKALKDGGIEVDEINSGKEYINLNGITVKEPEAVPVSADKVTGISKAYEDLLRASEIRQMQQYLELIRMFENIENIFCQNPPSK